MQHIEMLTAIVASLLVLITAIVAVGEDGATDRAKKTTRQICGPMCVHRVLQYYDQDVDLSSLVHEIQWPDLQTGASLAQLNAALTSRGIQARAAKIDREHSPSWRYPVILHLASADQEHDLGHFVVWNPHRPDEASVWDCDARDYVSWTSVKSRFTGAALLTSSDSGESPYASYIAMLSMVALLCGAVITVVVKRLY